MKSKNKNRLNEFRWNVVKAKDHLYIQTVISTFILKWFKWPKKSNILKINQHTKAVEERIKINAY